MREQRQLPGGRELAAQGFQFKLPFDVPATEGQPDWHFCRKCFAMFFDGSPNKGVCAAGGGHHNPTIGFHFVLPHDEFPTPSLIVNPIENTINPELELLAKDFTPLGRFDLTMSNVPGKAEIQNSRLFDRKGAFTTSPSFDIQTVSVDTELKPIRVSMQEDASSVPVVQETSAEPLVVRRINGLRS
jgi:hypothetical protein